MIKAGVIGLGMIGGGVASCLARVNLLAAVYDIFPEKAQTREGLPNCVESPAALAQQSDVVIVAVVDANQVKAVMTGDEGVLATAKPGLVMLVQSTLSLPDLKEIADIASKSGVAVVDCGVTGGYLAAENGLVSLVGTDEKTFDYIKPILDGYSKMVFHMGEFGTGMATKIARNAIVYASWLAAYEGALLAQAAGVDIATLAGVLNISAEAIPGPDNWIQRRRNYTDAQDTALREHVFHMLDKDLAAAQCLAGEVGVDLPAVTLTRQTGKKILEIED